MSSDQTNAPSAETNWQLQYAARANNRAWTLAETDSRSPAEDIEMLDTAHAAMHLWRQVGDASNQAHAELLVAHVHALLQSPAVAERYLARCAPVLLAKDRLLWEQAIARAVAANVAAAAGDVNANREYRALAEKLAASIDDPQDRAILNATLAVVPKL